MSNENTYTKEVELPISKGKAVIKTMITGSDKEFIDTAEARASRVNGKGELVAEPEKVFIANKHAIIDTYLVSIDGSEVDCRKRMGKLFEADYDAIMSAIETVKKTKAPETPIAS
jgi:hypothetical protein